MAVWIVKRHGVKLTVEKVELYYSKYQNELDIFQTGQKISINGKQFIVVSMFHNAANKEVVYILKSTVPVIYKPALVTK